MFKVLLMVVLVWSFIACSTDKPVDRLDGKRLLEQKCASCHELQMPPIVSDDELAPPMMAVSFHVYDHVKPVDESQRVSKAIAFVVDYVHAPSPSKSICDEKSLERYGLMPSQEGKVTKAEVKAIAGYMFSHYDPQELARIQKERASFEALPEGERLALRYRCMGCHKVERKVIGPSFKDIKERYVDDKAKITHSIRQGSREQWNGSNGAIMPPFEQIEEKEIDILSDWILQL